MGIVFRDLESKVCFLRVFFEDGLGFGVVVAGFCGRFDRRVTCCTGFGF